MQKIESRDRTLIDFLSYLLVFTCFFTASSMAVQGFLGVGAPFRWYLVMVLSSFAYIALYYDSRIVAKILPFVRGGKRLDRFFALLLLLPVAIPFLTPEDFPNTEYRYWIGIYIGCTFLLNIRHFGIYAHDLMTGVAKFIFTGMAVFSALLYIVVPPEHMTKVLPAHAGYLIVIVSVSVLLLHLLRLDRRTEAFVKKELLLIVLVLLAVTLTYFSGLITLAERAANALLDGAANVLRAFAGLLRFEGIHSPEQGREMMSTLEVSTEAFSTLPFSGEGDIPVTTGIEEEVELKPVNHMVFLILLAGVVFLAVYALTKRPRRKKIVELFTEERERVDAPLTPKEKKSSRPFFRRTPADRIRRSYARFMKLLPHPKDTTANLEAYKGVAGNTPAREQSASALTELYRKVRYTDFYVATERDAVESEKDIKVLESR